MDGVAGNGMPVMLSRHHCMGQVWHCQACSMLMHPLLLHAQEGCPGAYSKMCRGGMCGKYITKNFFCLSLKFVSPSVRTSWNTLSPLQKIISLSAGYSCLAYWKGCQCALVDPGPHGPRKEAITGIHVHLFKVGLFETKILIK